jgi:hypothetical protein
MRPLEDNPGCLEIAVPGVSGAAFFIHYLGMSWIWISITDSDAHYIRR